MNICSKCGRVSENMPNEAGEEFAEVLCWECDDSDSLLKPRGPITFTPEEIRCMELRVSKWIGYHVAYKTELVQNRQVERWMLKRGDTPITGWVTDEHYASKHMMGWASDWSRTGLLFDLLTEYNYQPTLESNMLTHKATGVLYAPNEQRVTVWADSPRVAILCLADAIAIRGRDFENNRRKIEIDNRA